VGRSEAATFAILEIVLEPVGEILAGLVAIAFAYSVGSVVFLLVRAARRSLRGLNPSTDVVDPVGRRWDVRVGLAPHPLRYRLSQWYFRMRPQDQERRIRTAGHADAVHRDEVAHPSGLLERFDEATTLMVWLLLGLTLVAAVVLLLEVVLVGLVAAVVFLLRTFSGQWQCEVVTPQGEHFHVPAGSLFQARDEGASLRQEIAEGVYRIPPGTTRTSPG
jgi:hypothetical protein